MSIVNVFDAKTNLSRLIEAVETGTEAEVVIARNGRPAARLVPLAKAAAGQRIGVAKGRFSVPESIDADDDLIAALFAGHTA